MGIEMFVRWLLSVFGIRVGENQAILSAHEELRGAVDLLHHEGRVEKHDSRDVRRRARPARSHGRPT